MQSFSVDPLENWKRKQWIGFFTALKDKLGEGDWADRGHRGGGSLTFRWHRKEDKYLRLDKDELAFCLEVTDAANRKMTRIAWARALMAKNGLGGITIESARRKLGKRMRVAVLKGDYRQKGERGLLDLDQTVETLKKAEALMDAALAESETIEPEPRLTI